MVKYLSPKLRSSCRKCFWWRSIMTLKLQTTQEHIELSPPTIFLWIHVMWERIFVFGGSFRSCHLCFFNESSSFFVSLHGIWAATLGITRAKCTRRPILGMWALRTLVAFWWIVRVNRGNRNRRLFTPRSLSEFIRRRTNVGLRLSLWQQLLPGVSSLESLIGHGEGVK